MYMYHVSESQNRSWYNFGNLGMGEKFQLLITLENYKDSAVLNELYWKDGALLKTATVWSWRAMRCKEVSKHLPKCKCFQEGNASVWRSYDNDASIDCDLRL